MKSAYGLSIPGGVDEICQPQRLAIVIYDMQVGIVSQISSGEEIVRGCHELVAAARAGGYRVFYTRHIFLPHQIAGVGQLRRAMIWQGKANPLETRPAFGSASQEAQITPQLQPQADEVVVDKITMSAFEGTYLNIALRDLGINAVVFAGIALEIGIEPTVRHALDLNYIPIVIPELCGSRTEELHQRSIASLRETGEVIFSSGQDVIAMLSSQR